MAVTRFSGPLRVASGLSVGGVFNVTGQIYPAAHMTGIQIATGAIKVRHMGLLSVTAGALATSSVGPMFSMAMGRKSSASWGATDAGTLHAAASATYKPWGMLVFDRAITVRGIGIGFGTAPRNAGGGAAWQVRLISVPSASLATTIKKSVVTFGIASGRSTLFKGSLSATFPARNGLSLRIDKVGTGPAGSGGQPTIHYTYR